MLLQYWPALLLASALQAVSGQNTSTSTTPCNNSPALCSRQYNHVTYLGAHDSPFLRDESTSYSTSGNQYYNTTMQLAAGVRLVTAQVQYPNGTTDLHVCHSDCDLLDAGTLSDWLSEVKAWMDSNPNDVVTVLLVNGAGASADQLASAFTSSNLADLAYTPGTGAATSTWPTLQSLISSGTRVLSFVDAIGDNTAAPYLMPEFNYMFENSYDNSQPAGYSCEVDRPANLVGQTSQAIQQGYLALVNHFLYQDLFFGIQSPNDTYANVTNAPSGGVGNLGTAAQTCATQYGQAPNFLLVDFFNVGPAIATVDSLNGVSNPIGRASVVTSIPKESTGMIPFPRLFPICLGLSATLLAMSIL